MAKIKMSIANDITFKEGCEEYLLDCKARNLRDGTLRHYRDSAKQIIKYVGEDMLIKNIDKGLIDDFIIQLRENPDLNETSMYTYARDFKTLIYFFMRKEYLSSFKIDLPKVDTHPIETYTDEELMILLKKPNLRQCTFTEYKVWVMTNFLLSTGVRRHSLISIMIKDVDFDSNVVYINVTKNRKPLIIPLNSDIRRILQEYLKYRKGEVVMSSENHWLHQQYIIHFMSTIKIVVLRKLVCIDIVIHLQKNGSWPEGISLHFKESWGIVAWQ